MSDLDKLIEAVEGGSANAVLFHETLGRSSLHAISAYNGSLDAAKALHEALLPGYDYSIDKENGGYSVHIWKELETVSVSASEQSDARAWLIAILKAYRAQVQQ